MPYRRLPNTDTARVKALQRALDLSKKYDPSMLAFKQNTLVKIQAFLPLFEQAILMQKEARTRQVANSKEFTESYKKAKLYISHFLQVFNFAVIRGEIKPSARKFFGIDDKVGKLPDLSTEKDVIEWGKKVIKGENDRVVKFGNPILCPKIAVVKVYYDEFIEKLNFQKMFRVFLYAPTTKWLLCVRSATSLLHVFGTKLRTTILKTQSAENVNKQPVTV